MKHIWLAVGLAAFFSGSSFADGIVKIEKYDGMNYEQARESLKNDGWVPLPLETPRDANDEFTELFTSKNDELEVCSKRSCAARYQRGTERIRVWLININANNLLNAKVESANYIGGTVPPPPPNALT